MGNVSTRLKTRKGLVLQECDDATTNSSEDKQYIDSGLLLNEEKLVTPASVYKEIR